MIFDVVVAVVSFLVGYSAGELMCLYRLYKAEKAGRIAIIKLPTKAELEALLTKATKSPVADSLVPKPKTTLLN